MTSQYNRQNRPSHLHAGTMAGLLGFMLAMALPWQACLAAEPHAPIPPDSDASAKKDLSILVVGNYLIMQGGFAKQIELVGEAVGLADQVRVATVESLYYHAPMVDAVPSRGPTLEEEAWLPLIRGKWDGEGRLRLNSKDPADRQAFVGKSPDLVLLMADLQGRIRHGVGGKGDEYYDHLAEVMKFYAKTCKENGARLVLWIHPGWQHAHNFRDPNTGELRPITEEEYAADLASIQKGLDKLQAAVPGIEYLPVPWMYARLRKEHPEVNLRPPIEDQNGHQMWREYLVEVYALMAYLGVPRPEGAPTVVQLNEAIYMPMSQQDHFTRYPNQDELPLTEAQQKAIIAAVWDELASRAAMNNKSNPKE